MASLHNGQINRRNFLRFSTLSGAALILGIPSVSAENTTPVITNLSEAVDFYNLSPFVIIEKSGKITIFNQRPEMGQGTFQSIPALIAEELGLSADQYTVQQTGGEAKFGKDRKSVV